MLSRKFEFIQKFPLAFYDQGVRFHDFEEWTKIETWLGEMLQNVLLSTELFLDSIRDIAIAILTVSA